VAKPALTTAPATPAPPKRLAVERMAELARAPLSEPATRLTAERTALPVEELATRLAVERTALPTAAPALELTTLPAAERTAEAGLRRIWSLGFGCRRRRDQLLLRLDRRSRRIVQYGTAHDDLSALIWLGDNQIFYRRALKVASSEKIETQLRRSLSWMPNSLVRSGVKSSRGLYTEQVR
jgi:hypothetical protein